MAWYKQTKRWCQTNLTEIDGQICDLDSWKDFWKENHIDGVVVNAGGIVSFYPSEDPLQYRSAYLGERDLFGEFVKEAREAGLAVIARMDCNRADEVMYQAHKEWFSVDAQGTPYCIDGRYIACVNGGYDKEYIPERLREIAKRYAPDGFADNSWQGLTTSQICYCPSCRKKFMADCGMELPAAVDWNDPIYRRWIQWSIDCRMENWRLFNAVTHEFGEDCLWLGMVNANPVDAHCAMYDLHELARTTPFLMVDHQSRDDLNGFEQNLCNGLLLHGICSQDALIAESMGHYTRGTYTFRRSAMPQKELELWMLSGIAGGISPWLHIVGAVQEDKRLLKMDREMMEWHKQYDRYFENRNPVANVGLVWSQQNVMFHGRDQAHVRCALPWRGFVRMLTRARIPYVPLCASDIPLTPSEIKLLILPDIAVMTEEQLDRLTAYVHAGGCVLTTGATGMLDELGNLRKDHRADEMFGIRREALCTEERYYGGWDQYPFHTYMRIEEPSHSVFAAFADTAILPFGGWRQPIEAAATGMKTLATHIPAFRYYPPEFAYMKETHTDMPLLLAGENQYGGRVIVLAADIDRRYGQAALPDHGDLLEGCVRWLLNDQLPIRIEGNGYLATALYEQQDKHILHIINLSGANASPGYAEQTYPIYGITIYLSAENMNVKRVRSLVTGKELPFKRNNGEWIIELTKLDAQECIVIES